VPPEPFSAAVTDVGVLDIQRFHNITIGHAWAFDYLWWIKKKKSYFILTN
jgi:prolyl oligopeptidase PreP (S9A serine peptidase family)